MYRHRRNNAVAGVTMLLGAILIAAGAFAPWATISGPTLALSIDGKSGLSLDFDTVPNFDTSGDSHRKIVIVVVAAVLGLLALALLVTRVRGLGLVWRIAALMTLVAPAALSIYLWKLVTGDPADVIKDPSASLATKLGGVLRSLGEHLGLIKIAPGLGLWLLSVGSILVFLGLWIPATRRMEPLVARPPYPPPWPGSTT